MDFSTNSCISQFNATDKKYLIGKRYENEKLTYGASDRFRGNQYTTNLYLPKNVKQIRTRKKIANETNTSEGYVERAYQFSKGLDAAESVCPGIMTAVLSGKIKIPANQIELIYKIPCEERREFIECLKGNKIKKSFLFDEV